MEKSNNTENDRLREIIKALESSDIRFALAMGVGVSTVSACTMKSRNKVLSRSFYKKLMNGIPFISEEYLDSGKGKMFSREPTEDERKSLKTQYGLRSNIRTSVSKELCGRVREIRHYNKDTQLSFSEKLQIDRGMVTAVEAGRQNPSLGLLEILVEKMDINLYWLLFGEGEMFGRQYGRDTKKLNDKEITRLNEVIDNQRLLLEAFKAKIKEHN
jgi:transcriptional regulator with XRE-family HTH domain